MRFVRGDTRDHIILCKSDHGASYRRYGVLHWWCRLKINVCEIFGDVRFSTFATISAHLRQAVRLLSEDKRTWRARQDRPPVMPAAFLVRCGHRFVSMTDTKT